MLPWLRPRHRGREICRRAFGNMLLGDLAAEAITIEHKCIDRYREKDWSGPIGPA
jgi:hypothetical protein